MTPTERAAHVKQRALALGFDAVGITDLRPVPHGAALERWLASGMAGTMTYMHRQAPRRARPATILPNAARAIVVTRNYYNPDPEPARPAGRVAKYARGRDYHTALREPLEQLCESVRALGSPHTVAKAYVDAGPVPERELAQRAGLGWIGKNTMFIDPRRGSFSFIATVLTDLDLATDVPFEADRCGHCTRCLDACPTDAFPEPRVLDARRCISYLTIEHRDEIDPALAALMDDWVFGCDICQDVCPWNNKFAQAAEDPVLALDSRLGALDLEELLRIDEADFNSQYGWTPLERPGVEGMRRNARIATRNATKEAAWRAP